VTEEMLEELEQDIQTMHNVGLKFSKHNDSGRTMIKVMDKENDQVIREIPAEDVLNLAVKIDEMIGILFDKEV
jgi:flagellar protein FlaG